MTKLSPHHIQAHCDMQLSGYLAGVTTDPHSPAQYFYADRIPSTVWNHAIFADPTVQEQYDFVLDQASKHQRTPAFFIQESAIDQVSQHFGPAVSIAREHWMLCTADKLPTLPHAALDDLQFHYNTVPPSDYVTVLTSLFADPDINDRFRDLYAPTLLAAPLSETVQTIHAVGYAGGRPVSCGSTYRIGDLAGIYNVGTCHNAQKQGFGAALSQALLAKTFEQGATEVFLQCVVGTHVQDLYAGLGFEIIETPAIVSFA